MTFEHWWDRPEGCGSTPDTYKGWENSCRVSYEAGAADSKGEIESLRQRLILKEHQYDVMKASAEVLAEQCDKMRQQLADAQAEVEEESAVRERLAKLLAETAIALKGEEAALTKHSWHDLAQCATEVINERDDHIKREVMMRDALIFIIPKDSSDRPEWSIAAKAIAYTADLKDVRLCEKEPVAFIEKITSRLAPPEDNHYKQFWMCYEPLYRACEPK